MRDVTLVGGTGFVGMALAEHLVQQGRQVSIVSRRPDAKVPAGVKLVADGTVPIHPAVVNLAGATIATRWTDAAWAEIEDSRVRLTRSLVERFADQPPEVFVCASAVGFYGDCGEDRVTEARGPGADRAARLCEAWEAAAVEAEALGVRTVRARLGIVLGRGGALKAMLPAFRMGAGGPLGSGQQWFPWVHLDDAVRALTLCIDQLQGPVNVVGPSAIRQKDFARTLGATLKRPAFLPAPKFAIKLGLGEAAEMLLASQNAAPQALLDAGFTFRWPELQRALADVV